MGPLRQGAQLGLACTTRARLCLFRACLQQRYREPRCGTAASHAPPAPMSDGSCSPAPCWHCGHHHALSQGPTHPVPVSAAWGPSKWVGWVLSWQPQNPAGSTAVHQGQARQRPRCHAGMVPFISRGQRKEEEPCALHAKAALWLPAGEQGRGQTKQQLPELLAMRVPKPMSPGTPRHSAGLVPHASAGQAMLQAEPCQLPMAMLSAGAGKPGGRAGLCPARLQQRRVVAGHHHLLG